MKKNTLPRQLAPDILTAEDVRMRMLGEAIILESKARYAKHLGISEAYLSDILSRKRAPGAKVLKALNLERVIFYRPLTRTITAPAGAGRKE